jgi:hypothetical protein
MRFSERPTRRTSPGPRGHPNSGSVDGAEEDPLVFDERLLGTISPRHDPDGDLGFTKASVENLARVGWLLLDKSGREWRVRRGPVWRDLMKRREES